MGRLRALAPTLGALSPRLANPVDAHGHSPTLEPWRKWYSLKRWADLRRQVFVRDLFTCRMADCGRLISNPRERVCDHVKPHRGDPQRFWDPTNLQTLCKPCHDRRKQAEEAAARASGP